MIVNAVSGADDGSCTGHINPASAQGTEFFLPTRLLIKTNLLFPQHPFNRLMCGRPRSQLPMSTVQSNSKDMETEACTAKAPQPYMYMYTFPPLPIRDH